MKFLEIIKIGKRLNVNIPSEAFFKNHAPKTDKQRRFKLKKTPLKGTYRGVSTKKCR